METWDEDLALAPTFWRTCRVLEGGKRIQCLRSILKTPGLDVSSVAEIVKIRVDEASRALRALQSRGLLTGDPFGRHVRYVPVPNKSVRTAVDLLLALRKMLELKRVSKDQIRRQMKAFRHTRRLKIMKVLAEGPCPLQDLQQGTGISEIALYRHLALLEDLGHVRKNRKGLYHLVRPTNRIARALQAAFFAL